MSEAGVEYEPTVVSLPAWRAARDARRAEQRLRRLEEREERMATLLHALRVDVRLELAELWSQFYPYRAAYAGLHTTAQVFLQDLESVAGNPLSDDLRAMEDLDARWERIRVELQWAVIAQQRKNARAHVMHEYLNVAHGEDPEHAADLVEDLLQEVLYQHKVFSEAFLSILSVDMESTRHAHPATAHPWAERYMLLLHDVKNIVHLPDLTLADLYHALDLLHDVRAYAHRHRGCIRNVGSIA